MDLHANGNWSETGSAELKNLIPTTMIANTGYHNGSWDVTPPEYVTGSDAVIYTYSYVVKPASGVDTGDESDILFWSFMMFASLAAMYVLIRRRKYFE